MVPNLQWGLEFAYFKPRPESGTCRFRCISYLMNGSFFFFFLWWLLGFLKGRCQLNLSFALYILLKLIQFSSVKLVNGIDAFLRSLNTNRAAQTALLCTVHTRIVSTLAREINIVDTNRTKTFYISHQQHCWYGKTAWMQRTWFHQNKTRISHNLPHTNTAIMMNKILKNVGRSN